MASNKEANRTTVPNDQEKQGVIGSMMKAVQGTYENAKEAVVGKRDVIDPPVSHTTTEVVHVIDDDDGRGEVRDISANKSRGVYDSANNKAKEAKDTTKDYAASAGEKAKEAKDKTVDKAGEYKDCAVEKAKEGKDSATDAAKRAMGYLGDKKEETKEKASETAKQKAVEAKDNTKDMMKEADEEARRKTEGLKLGDKGLREENWRRGNEGVIKADDTDRTGRVAETLKAADQMTGQTFNDVGRMDDEGVARVGGILDIKKNDI